MRGIISLSQHIITIGLIWLLLIIIIYIIKQILLKNINKTIKTKHRKNKRNYINRVIYYINMSMTVIALFFILICCLFLYNPTERTYEKMNKIRQSPIEKSFKQLTKEEIDSLNKMTIENQHKEKEEKAELENQEAMEKAINLFDELEKKAEKETKNNE